TLHRKGRVSSKVVVPLPTKWGTSAHSVAPYELLTDSYKAETNNGKLLRQEKRPEISFFRSTPYENDSSFLRLALRNGQIEGLLYEDATYYSIATDINDKNTLLIEELDQEQLKHLIARCGLTSANSQSPNTDSLADSLLLPEVAYATTKTVEIATDADYEYVTASGDSTAANAAILSVLNGVSGIYESELGITLTVSYQHSWTTSSDPFSTSDAATLLDQFYSHWESNFRASHTYDVAHLFTGRNLNDSTIGIAYMNAACRSYGYGLSERQGSITLDTPLAAHEIGHNLGADHDSCTSGSSWIMCPMLVPGANRFSSGSKTQIANYTASVSCLGTSGGTPTPPPPSDNLPPVLSPIGAKSISENQVLQFDLSASDPDGDTISYSITPITGASLSGNTFTYRPVYSTVSGGKSSTVITLTFTAVDSGGASDRETVSITVSNVNRAPVVSTPATITKSEGETITGKISGADADSEVLSYIALTTLPSGMTLNRNNGEFAWKPRGEQSGSYSINIKVKDIWGASVTTTLNLNIANRTGISPTPAHHAVNSFADDGKSLASVFRPATGTWYEKNFSSPALAPAEKQFALQGDIPVVADFNGDNLSDRTVFRPSTGEWVITDSGSAYAATYAFGLPGDIPVPADYDGDRRDDLAVYRPSIHTVIYSPSGSESSSVNISLGDSTDQVLACDFDGDETDDLVSLNQSSYVWTIRLSASSTTSIQWGLPGDIPVPADFTGDGNCDVAVWRPSNGTWYIRSGNQAIQFGLGGDIPLPLDTNGDGIYEPAVWRSASGLWFVRHNSNSFDMMQLGLSTDTPSAAEAQRYMQRRHSGSSVARSFHGYATSLQLLLQQSQTLYTAGNIPAAPRSVTVPDGGQLINGDYDGDGLVDTAVFFMGYWSLYLGNGALQYAAWGLNGDIPISGDFDGDGKSDLAVFRPDNGGGFSAWYVIRSSTGLAEVYSWGLATDTPVPGDYNGDGWTDITVWRPASGSWFVMDARSKTFISMLQWGLPGDKPRTGDMDGDGKDEMIVWRPASGTWYTNFTSGGIAVVQWGLDGDIPLTGYYQSNTHADYAVYRPGNGSLYTLSQTGAAQSFTVAGLNGNGVIPVTQSGG
ncbi:MAG: M12 family metallo-peptidase, partial [bacterium]|nr:M12 family metallo-peptidase [bacterium]